MEQMGVSCTFMRGGTSKGMFFRWDELPADREERDRFLESLIREAELVEIAESVQVCRDPKDDHVLELAVNGNASFVVTGDADLLELSPFREVRIMTPARLLGSFGLPSILTIRPSLT